MNCTILQNLSIYNYVTLPEGKSKYELSYEIDYKLVNGHTSSCGCLQKERFREASITHGLRHSTEYSIWTKMKQRCLNPKDRAYSNYGGRGITVCDRWKDSFENFYEDMGARPTLQHEIERNDNNGSYHLVWTFGSSALKSAATSPIIAAVEILSV